MQHISHGDLKRMMLLSYERIEKEKEAINKINVFPVPDQDTGNNIAKTLAGIKERIHDKDFKSVKDISEAILDGALTAAQGNAGVIYTGFLAGFLSELSDKADVGNLAAAFEKGSARAKESVQDPKQGTILDVIEAAAGAFGQAGKEKDILDVFKTAVQDADDALVATRDKMEILKKANVVDAGGMAFLIILESFSEALGGMKKTEKPAKSSEKIKRFIQILSNRYEVVALIRSPKVGLKGVKEKLKHLGNSIDVVKVKDKLKVHIHSDYPDDVKVVLREIGKMEDLRVEDLASEVVGESSVKTVSIGIVCGSSAMLLDKIIDRYGIEVVDCESKLAGQTSVNRKVRESGLSHEDYLDSFKKQLKTFNYVICITASSKLYDNYGLAVKAKEMSSEPGRILVFDSLNLGPGEALVVLKTLELIHEQHDIREIAGELEKFVLNIHSCIIPERIRKDLKKVRINPVIEIRKGLILKTGVVFAQDSAEAMAKIILKKSKKDKSVRLIIGYGQDKEAAESAKAAVKRKIKSDVPFIAANPASVSRITGSNNLIASWAGLNKI